MLRLTSVLSVLLLSSTAFAFTAPNLMGRVNDYANLLSPGKRAELEEKSKALEAKTSAQVVILTVPSLEGMEMKDFTLKCFETWKLGQKDKNNGLILGYSPDGDHFRIEVGYGLEGAIPDGKAGDILRNSFRKYAPKDGKKDFDAAFTASFDNISSIIYSEFEKDPTGKSMEGTNGGFILALLTFGLVTLFAGLANPVVGGVVGGICGWICAAIGSVTTGWFVALVIIGIIIGVVLAPLFKALGEGDGSGGYCGGFFDGIGDGGFSGGGGCGGGGGAGD